MFSRRQALTLIGVTASGTLLPRALLAESASVYLLPDTDVCLLTPEVTEGPYYVADALLRRDIREDKEGVPLTLRIQVVDAFCLPMAGARVDVWHCDAQGIYSQFGGGDSGQTSSQEETFLRGIQMADETGTVEFDTIYPGWYSGRTTHIHYKVWIDETNVLTGQIFFPDALSEFLYLNVDPYARDRERDTLNAMDGIAEQATRASYAGIKEEADRYLAQIIVGVDPLGISTAGPMPDGAEAAPGGGGMPPGGEGGQPPGPPPGGDGATPPDGGAMAPPGGGRTADSSLVPGT